ncbi:hypothetical protein [Corynebacterium auris]|nr:hypothetical protein [Corynebacterium auris]WJY68646.1 hypothetical protein CAURIS_08790 [Corynebacterium auris]
MTNPNEDHRSPVREDSINDLGDPDADGDFQSKASGDDDSEEE